MNRQDLVNVIVRLCDTEEGFLIPLRCSRLFKTDKYTELVTALQAYNKVISTEDTIDKQVAHRLFYLLRILEDTLALFNTTAADDSEHMKGVLQSAVVECWEISEEMFTLT